MSAKRPTDQAPGVGGNDPREPGALDQHDAPAEALKDSTQPTTAPPARKVIRHGRLDASTELPKGKITNVQLTNRPGPKSK